LLETSFEREPDSAAPVADAVDPARLPRGAA
jgi:hypothetical protein